MPHTNRCGSPFSWEILQMSRSFSLLSSHLSRTKFPLIKGWTCEVVCCNCLISCQCAFVCSDICSEHGSPSHPVNVYCQVWLLLFLCGKSELAAGKLTSWESHFIVSLAFCWVEEEIAGTNSSMLMSFLEQVPYPGGSMVSLTRRQKVCY